MDSAMQMVYVRFYIKQIRDAKSLVELPQDPYYDNSDVVKNRRKIKYRNKYFCKAEIMGLVVMRQSKDNRLIYVIDDSTGVIEASIWQRSQYYNEAEIKIKNSHFVKILGTFDFYYERKCFDIEKITIVDDMDKEILFHKLLYDTHERIFTINLKENIETKITSKTLEKTSSEYNAKKKEFANKFLVFFLLYEVKNEENDDTNYVTIKVEDLLSYENFYFMMKDFVVKNNIENVDHFLKDVFCFLQEKNFLQMKSDNNDLYNYLKNSSITVKACNQELEKSLLTLFSSQNKDRIITVNYNEIFDFQSKKFFNYYTNEYIWNFLRYLCEKKTLIELCHNTFALYDYFN